MAKVNVRVPIEVDITYVNKTWYTTKKKVTKDEKHYVIGFFQREGKCIIEALPDNNPETIEKSILDNVQKGAMIFCEENIVPYTLDDDYEIYELKSSEGERVSGDIHVNNVKNMWKDLKRVIKRTHIQVSKKHLQLYCSEVAWRVNTRHLSDSERFELALNQLANNFKRTPYNKLIE